MQQWKQQNKWNCQQSRSKQVQSKVPSSMSLYLEPLKVLPHLWWAFPLQKGWSRKSLTGVPLSFHWFQIYPRWQPRLAIIFAGHLQVSSLHCFYAAYHTIHSQSKGISRRRLMPEDKKRAMQCCLLDMTSLQYSWTHSSHVYLHEDKPAQIPAWIGKGSWGPTTSWRDINSR